MKKNTKIIWALIIIVCLGGGGFFVYNKFYSSSATLSFYLPQETEHYLEIDLSDDSLRQNLQFNQKLKKYFFDYLVGEGISDNILELDKNSIIGLAKIRVNQEIVNVWLVENSNIHQIETLLPKNYYFKTLNNKTAVLSEKYEIINLFKEQDKETKLDVESGKLVDYLGFSVRGFVSKEYLLQRGIRQDEFRSIWALVLEETGVKDEFSFGFRISDQLIEFKADAGKLAGQSRSDDQLFNYIPSLGYVVAVNSINLGDVWDGLLDQVVEIDENMETNISLADELAKKYNFSWYKLKEIFEQPCLLVMKPKDNNLSGMNLFDLNGFDYVFVLKDVDEQKREELADVFRNFLAFKYPTTSQKVLPDGTSIRELVAQSENIEFVGRKVENELNQGFVVYVYENEDFGFSFTNIGEQMVFGNSIDLVEQIAKNYQSGKKDVFISKPRGCNSSLNNQVVVLNPNLIKSDFLALFNQVIFGLDKEHIEGCFVLR